MGRPLKQGADSLRRRALLSVQRAVLVVAAFLALPGLVRARTADAPVGLLGALSVSPAFLPASRLRRPELGFLDAAFVKRVRLSGSGKSRLFGGGRVGGRYFEGFTQSAVGRALAAATRDFCAVPLGTRSWVVASLALSLLSSGRQPLVPPELICMHGGRTFRALEVWRPFSAALFYGPFSFATLTRIYAASSALRRLESDSSKQALLQAPCEQPRHKLSAQRREWIERRQTQLLSRQRELQRLWKDPKAFAKAASESSATAHLLQFLMFECALLAAASCALRMPFYSASLTAASTYLISREHPEATAQLPLGLSIPQKALPFALAALDALQAQQLSGAYPALLGIAAGHVFYVLKKVSAHARRQTGSSEAASPSSAASSANRGWLKTCLFKGRSCAAPSGGSRAFGDGAAALSRSSLRGTHAEPCS